MSKSYKLKDGNYISDKSIAHGQDSVFNMLENLGAYTKASGKYTTAAWGTGSNSCIWTAPETGIYIIWASFSTTDDGSKTYKQLHLRGTSTKLLSDNVLLYQQGESYTSSANLNKSIVMYKGCIPIYAEKGQTVTPYVHSPVAGNVWNVTILGMRIK